MQLTLVVHFVSEMSNSYDNTSVQLPPTSQTLYYDVDGVLLNFSRSFSEHWNEGITQGKWNGPIIHENSDCWYLHGTGPIHEQNAIDRQVEVFHQTHEPLPLMHQDIPLILKELSNQYVIQLVTAYPHLDRRIANLALHDLKYHRITCNVTDKLAHIQAREREGWPVKAIFEDGPHHLEKLLSHYGGKVWAPRCWNYLRHLHTDPRVRLYDHPMEWNQI